MFTGLIEDRGQIVHLRPLKGGIVLEIACDLPLSECKIGDSIAVNGVCLTVETLNQGSFVATAARETLAATNFSGLRVGSGVHVERAMSAKGRFDGHIVQGHVDGIARLNRTEQQGESTVFWVEAPAELARYIAKKGSICIQGVSLTVNEIQDRLFRVNLVPHSMKHTWFGDYKVGDPLNIEVDILAKYVERLLTQNHEGKHKENLMETLKKSGF